MASSRTPEEVLVLLSSLTNTGNAFPERLLTLSKDNPAISIGRSSKRRLELEPSANNAFFDCPVMSREHAELHLDTEKRAVTLQDTSSLHGTLLNKLALRPTETRVVKSGDIISFGLAIDRGADKFTPHEVEAQITWHTKKPSSNVVTYRVPDDTDVEELSDKEEDFEPELSFARKVIRENHYHVLDYKGNRVDLTTQRLPPISSFDTPSNVNVMVDLTSDESSSWDRSDPSVPKHPTNPSGGRPPHPVHDQSLSVGYAQPASGIAQLVDHPLEGLNDEDDVSYESHSHESPSDEDELSDDAEVESSDGREGADLNLSEIELSDDEADPKASERAGEDIEGEAKELWGLEDDDFESLDVDGAVPKLAAATGGPQQTLLQPPTFGEEEPPKPQSFANTLTEDQNLGDLPTFPPTEFSFTTTANVPKATAFFTPGDKDLAYRSEKAEFLKAREVNRKTLGLPPKSEQVKNSSQPAFFDDIELKNNPDAGRTNEWLRSGDDFLNEPIKDSKGDDGAAIDKEPMFDESSAYQFHMSKKAAGRATDAKEDLSAEPSQKSENNDMPTLKRKSDNISRSSLDEEDAVLESEPAPAPIQREKEKSNAPVIAQTIFSGRGQRSNMVLSDPFERAPKRLRRTVEAVGYAAIGGIAVMSALIATAPQL